MSSPHASRKSRAMQYFFINGRLVKSKTALAALEQAYKNSIMVGRFPACVLNMTVNTALVDVNVHPAKIEVRFANEKPVFDLVYYGVKTAIETGDSVKEATFGGTPAADEVGRAYRRQQSQRQDRLLPQKGRERANGAANSAPYGLLADGAGRCAVPYRAPGADPGAAGGRAKRSADGARADTCKSDRNKRLGTPAAPVVQREQEVPAKRPRQCLRMRAQSRQRLHRFRRRQHLPPTVQVVDETGRPRPSV